jgi:hypothetical protein
MQEPQPRERDYFYVGSFFIFSIWIGMGVLGVVQLLQRAPRNRQVQAYIAGGVLLFSAALIPGNMLRTNYKDANRTGDYAAWDYSYNLLQTCEPDAILFTNGDNDTFPLWYLQDVEGIRRDIRIVNLSLANTPWYVAQLKNETPFGAKKIPIGISDDQIERLEAVKWEPRRMILPVPQNVVNEFIYLEDALKQLPLVDTSVTRSGIIRFTFPNTIMAGSVKAIRAQDIVTWNIISTNKWQRPIYFAVTCTLDSKIGLERYFRMDGLAARLVPIQAQNNEGIIVDTILATNLYNSPSGYSKTFQRGYKYRGLNDSTVYYDENVTRLMLNYRNAFLRLAMYHLNITHDSAKAREALDWMEVRIPQSVFPIDNRLLYNVANFYKYAGVMDKYNYYADEVTVKLLDFIKRRPNEPLSESNPYIVLLAVYESRREYEKAIGVLNEINDRYAGTATGIAEQVKERIAKLRTKMSVNNAAIKDTVVVQSR